MKINKIIFTILIIPVAFFVFGKTQNAKAEVPFTQVGLGATEDEGLTVTDPTVLNLETPIATRYLRIEARNDFEYEDCFGEGGECEEGEEDGYIELRNVKAWAGGSENVLRGIYSGGNAQVVEINAYNGDEVYRDDLSVGCDSSWYPQGSLCDEAPNTDSKYASSKTDEDSGATWDTDSPESTGVLVIDMGSVQNLTELRVFQMFSDGKTTQIRFAYHPETEGTPPAWDDAEWVLFPEEDTAVNSDDEDENEKAHIDSWSAYKYIDRTSGSCQEKIKLTVKGKYFDKNAQVRIGDKEAALVEQKSSKKITAKFCLAKLQKIYLPGTPKVVSVKNPHTSTVKAKKKIDLYDLIQDFKNGSSKFNASTTEGIKNIQSALVKLGYLDYQHITGIYGSITTEAVKKFQTKQGIAQTGFVGPLTQAVLEKEID